ncbi:MAG TPA: hypothetical protein VLG27_01860 [Candidatus Saccharimonadia bacterium]|nr:hypothetical protein [Candidatus Saccharimonadia bacterium]
MNRFPERDMRRQTAFDLVVDLSKVMTERAVVQVPVGELDPEVIKEPYIIPRPPIRART